jgi:hypothetical protein
MSKIFEILEGWGNLIKDGFNMLDAESKELSESRLLHCHGCDMRLGSICNPNRVAPHKVTNNLTRGCGCNIAAKSMTLLAQCPLGNW